MLITALLLTISMFGVTTFYGMYLHKAYARDVMLRSNLQNGGYLMVFDSNTGISFDEPDYFELIEAFYSEQRKTIEAFPACKYLIKDESFGLGILNDADAFYTCYAYDKNHRLAFPLEVDRGRWLSEDPEYTEAVIIGNDFGNKVGDELLLEGGIKAVVVGISEGTPFCPSFGSSSNSECNAADYLFGTRTNRLYITKETVDPKLLKDTGSYYGNCYVVFDENASAAERDELIRHLESLGTFAPYEKIIADSNEDIDEWIRLAFPLPVFLAAVCTISILCICTVIIKRSMNEYSKYYLLGCTKKRVIYLVTAPMIFFFGVPCAANLLSVLAFPHFLRAGDMYFYKQDYILDHRAALLVICYFAVLAALLVIMPKMFYRKYSPLSLYRRNL